jgi:acyl-CoA dehydrogenase
MTSFTPTDEQQQLIDTVRRYANTDVRPIAHDADEHGETPVSVTQTGWEIGCIPVAIPEDLGGLGDLSAVNGVLVSEELAYGDLSVAMQVMAPALFAYPLILCGTPEQQRNLLPMFLDAKPARATAALIEPGVFFDPRALKTTATVHGDKVTLNGTKAYVPLAGDADWLLVYARDSESGKVDGYLVSTEIAGVEVQEREKLMGLRALPTYRVHLANAEVDLPCRLGGEAGADFDMLLNRSRVALAALAVGVARGAYEYARDYAKQRVQFGKPIAQNQAIAFMLAEMAIEVDAARLMAWEAAWKIDQGQDASREAYLAKQYADKR